MKRTFILYVAAALIFFPLDMLWLGLVARDFYKSQLGELLLVPPHWGVAIVFYLIYLAGLVTFVMVPAANGGTLQGTLVFGALFGMVAYATYDLTNLATLKGYPLPLALVDMTWGAALSAISATAGLALARLVTDLG